MPLTHSAATPPSWLAELGWVDRFEVLDLIGSGGMGQVWRARERATGRIVALKILDPARAGDDHLIARLDGEAAALMKLREAGANDHIVPILDFALTDRLACLVMEFIPGLNLKRWCATHPLSLTERARLISQVARASGSFHALGIVHRDLKPANILVSAITNLPVIVDFSIAKAEDALTLTLTNEALGTAPYMAPEQFDRRRAPASPATDVYALGATLYELLAKVPPHPGEFAVIAQRHHDEVRPAPPSALSPDVPRDLDSIILKSLSHRPSERYADGIALAEDLERFLAGKPVIARPLPLTTRLMRQARRKPALTAAITICLALGSAAIWTMKRRTDDRALHSLEAQISACLQQRAWTAADLQQAESLIASLAASDPTAAPLWNDRLQADVLKDVETSLRQPQLADSDFGWLREAAAWMKKISPAQSQRFSSLIAERESRWEAFARLKEPFADMQGLFARSQTRTEGGLLLPVYPSGAPFGIASAFLVSSTLPVPMEVNGVFFAGAAPFHHVAIEFYHSEAKVSAAFYAAKHIPSGVRAHLKLPAESEGYVLFMAQNRHFSHAVHIPDQRLLDAPFHFSLRVEKQLAEAAINHQWRLQLDSPLALGSTAQDNVCRISWPPGLGLKELTLKTRRADAASPLEKADLLFRAERYSEAQRLYESLQGDPVFGAEADYKLADCLAAAKDAAGSRAIWQRLSQGAPGLWQQMGACRLWLDAARQGDLATASRYLALLPAPESAPASLRALISGSDKNAVSQAYVRASRGLNELSIQPQEATAALKALQFLGVSQLAIASRLASAFHHLGMDEAAEQLLHNGLSMSQLENVDDPAILQSATTAFDYWTRMTRSEVSAMLSGRLSQLQKSFPETGSFQAIVLLEQARVAARAGDYEKALAITAQAREWKDADGRLLAYSHLLQGMCHRLAGRESDAQAAFQRGITFSAEVKSRTLSHLGDLIALHCQKRAWSREACAQVLTTFMAKSQYGQASNSLQSAFIASFLIRDEFISALNTINDDPRGPELAREYTLRARPAREVNRRWWMLILERFFLSAAFPADASAAARARVTATVEQILEAVAVGQGSEQDLFEFVSALYDPAAASAFLERSYPYRPELMENLRWLLQQRHP